ncbi:MAG: hypothetical protein ACFFGZ_09840 [Candidatus Thorarchaeota archaeon]
MNIELTGSQWDRYCWFAGSLLQKKLLRLEGKRIPSPEKLREENPNLSIAESIEQARETTAPRLIDRRVFVQFSDKWFDVTSEVEEAIIACKEDTSWIENVGVDTRSLNVSELAKMLSELAVSIADGKYPPITEPPPEIEKT